LGKFTQDHRPIQVLTPLGKDELLLQGFSGSEGISRLFRFDLWMHSEKSTLDFAQIIGKKATIRIKMEGGKFRHLNGLIDTFAQAGSTQVQVANQTVMLANYTAALVPWLFMLSYTSDCRIYQDKTAPEIIEAVFKENDFSDFALRLQGSFRKREYCVQWNETDLNFVLRLMEEEGIFYFFEHEESKHTLVLANQSSDFKPSPLYPTARYESLEGAGRREDVITEWTIRHQVRPGKYEVKDFNFEKPTQNLTASVTGKDPRKLEMRYYPGEYTTMDEGEALAGIRMQEEAAPAVIAEGASTCRGFVPGFRFDLKGHYRRDLNDKSYVVTSVHHHSDQGNNYVARERVPREQDYLNRFQCIPHPTPFRPERVTPVPQMRGAQTAIVVGPSGEEIFVDKYGRIKVQFHWDREGEYNDKSSCWIRVAQPVAGKKWGVYTVPRIGQEVVVDFLNGDPDQPIVVGSVYNAECMPPYALPDEKTKSTFKSYSSKGGGGFNEIRFEDKKGSEQLFIQAEKNQDNRVKNDSMEWVGANRHLIVGADQLELVSGDKHLHVKGDQNEKVDGTVSLNAGMDLQEKVGMNYALDAGMEIHLKSGMNVVIESGTTLTLKVGGNFVNLNPAGVFISGTMVMINSGGAAGSGSGASPAAPKDPKEADKAEPGQKVELPKPKQRPSPASYSPAALVMKEAAANGTPFCDT
jgi:type VI secretion system secreted protein VgrG